MSSIKTVGEFTRALESVLTFTSPVGQEEVVKFSAGNILDILSQKGQPEEASRKIAEYIEPYLFKDDVRHLLTLAQIYAALWRNYGREEYFQKAESYYRQGLSISPKMPPLLYGLFGLYGAKGDAQKISEIGTKILTYWPNDASISRVFNR
jgi:tetratricopeptide (TPR) repeat protein